MRLVRFEKDGKVATGIAEGDGVIDLAAAGAPLTDIMAIIAGGDEALAAIRAATAGRTADHRLADVRLLAPYRPLKYLAIGMNYAKHVAEAERLGVARPEHQ